MSNGDERASIAHLKGTEVPYSASRGDKTSVEINCEHRPTSFHPHARQTRNTPGNSGREAYMCEKLHAENVVDNIQRQTFENGCQYMFSLWLLWCQVHGQVLVLFGTTISVASCSLRIISFFFALPCCSSESCLSEADVVSKFSWWNFWGANVFLLSLTIALCVLALNYGSSDFRFGLQFCFRLFFHLPSVFSDFPFSNVPFPDPCSSCMLARPSAMLFEVHFVV